MISNHQCQCDAPGFCKLFSKEQSQRAWELCSGKCPTERPCPEESVRQIYISNLYGVQTRPAQKSPTNRVYNGARRLPQRLMNTRGPGTELKKLLADLGIHPKGCGCKSQANRMNALGVVGCRVHRDELIDSLRKEGSKRSWWTKASAGFWGLLKGLSGKITASDPYPGLIDEAIRRAENGQRNDVQPVGGNSATNGTESARRDISTDHRRHDMSESVSRSSYREVEETMTQIHLPAGLHPVGADLPIEGVGNALESLNVSTEAKHKLVTYAVGLTTVPDRANDLLPRTIKSLRAAGFSDIRLFADGIEDSVVWNVFGLPATSRNTQIGAFGNWALALLEMCIRSPHASRYAIFQDDLVTVRNLKGYLDRCQLRDNQYWNLYTFPDNQVLSKGTGWFHAKPCSGWGALGLMFTRATALKLLGSQAFLDWPRYSSNNIDGTVVKALWKLGIRECCHNPSLVQHCGSTSVIRKGPSPHPLANSFPGEEFDALTLIESATALTAEEPSNNHSRVRALRSNSNGVNVNIAPTPTQAQLPIQPTNYQQQIPLSAWKQSRKNRRC